MTQYNPYAQQTQYGQPQQNQEVEKAYDWNDTITISIHAPRERCDRILLFYPWPCQNFNPRTA